ncbi:MAG: hypothetical protein Q7O66_18110, partial [Dehalococcoidia bacterium]|nr:hypothetical protein [Dehalococcoidia bacterium]
MAKVGVGVAVPVAVGVAAAVAVAVGVLVDVAVAVLVKVAVGEAIGESNRLKEAWLPLSKALKTAAATTIGARGKSASARWVLRPVL